MKRTVIKIDENLCYGCGNCVSGCHEGALQLVGGKAVMVSDLYCDGLGACIGDCPVGAISFEEREAEPYDEFAVMQRLLPRGPEVILAHLSHLKKHGETKWFEQGVKFLRENETGIDLSSLGINNGNGQLPEEPAGSDSESAKEGKLACGCPGTAARMIERSAGLATQARLRAETPASVSELSHFPVQLALLNPAAGFLHGSDLLLAADCTAFACGDFHNRLLKGKTLAVACPKLDDNLRMYTDKLVRIIDESRISSLTVAIMEVPCCRGLLRIAREAIGRAERKVPLKVIVVSVNGEIKSEEWF